MFRVTPSYIQTPNSTPTRKVHAVREKMTPIEPQLWPLSLFTPLTSLLRPLLLRVEREALIWWSAIFSPHTTKRRRWPLLPGSLRQATRVGVLAPGHCGGLLAAPGRRCGRCCPGRQRLGLLFFGQHEDAADAEAGAELIGGVWGRQGSSLTAAKQPPGSQPREKASLSSLSVVGRKGRDSFHWTTTRLLKLF